MIRFMIRPAPPVTVDHVVDHVEHLVKLIGPEHVGIGSDLDMAGLANPLPRTGTPLAFQPAELQSLQRLLCRERRCACGRAQSSEARVRPDRSHGPPQIFRRYHPPRARRQLHAGALGDVEMMRVRDDKYLILSLLLVAPLLASEAQAPAPRPAPRARVVVIDSVTVVDVAARRLIAQQRIVIRGDSIVAVQSVGTAAPDTIDERINGRGTFAIPGLVDHHVHLTPGMSRSLAQAARGGVTMVQAMAGDGRVAGEFARMVIARELAGPEIAYASVMAGPDFFVDPRFLGAGVGVHARHRAVGPGGDVEYRCRACGCSSARIGCGGPQALCNDGQCTRRAIGGRSAPAGHACRSARDGVSGAGRCSSSRPASTSSRTRRTCRGRVRRPFARRIRGRAQRDRTTTFP